MRSGPYPRGSASRVEGEPDPPRAEEDTGVCLGRWVITLPADTVKEAERTEILHKGTVTRPVWSENVEGGGGEKGGKAWKGG